MTCGCNDKCELPKALQINNPGEVTLFHRVDIPASQGDDTTYPPKNGLYRNVLLVYLANNHSYLYNSDGIPTRVDGPAGPGTAAGGETGQVLAKRSDADYDTTWVTQTSANDATLTISRNDTPVGTFTANASVDKTIDIEVPTKTSDLTNDGATGESTYAEATDIADIWEEIEEIEAASDVTDVVGTYAELEAYDTSKLKDNDIIKVLEDETQDDQITYYRWDTDTETFTLIGAIGPYYTKSEADTTFQDKLTAGSNISIDANNEISATDTTYSDFTGATSSVAGAHGLVPAPTTSDPDKFLKGDGTWGTPPGATYTGGTGIDITDNVVSVDNTIATVTDLGEKVDIASIDLTGQTTTLLALTKALGTNNIDYARWECRTDIGSANISDKPTGYNASFVCEAYCNRWTASNDYRYQLICWVKENTNPFVAYIANNSSSITWERLRPTVNDATLTIQQNGTTVETFTANSSTNKTANITVPTKTSDLTNDGADGASTYVEANELAPGYITGEGTNITLPGTQGGRLSDIKLKGDTTQGIALPDGYQQVEYIASAGGSSGAYIDSGVKASNTIKVVTTAALTSGFLFGEGLQGNWVNFGIQDGNGYYRGRIRKDASSNSEVTSTVALGDTFHTIEMSQGNGLWIDGSQIGTFTNYTFTATNTMYIHAWQNGSGANLRAVAKIKDFKIYNNSTLVKWFVPCKRISDGVAGYYEMVEGTFKPSASGTAFTAGVVSPTPSTPQAVQTVTGEQTIAINDGDQQSQTYTINLGKNLLDTTITQTGFINTSGVLQYNTTAQSSAYIEVLPNTTYTASATATCRYIGFAEYTSEKTFIGSVQQGGDTTSYSITTTAATKFIRVFYNKTSTVTSQTLRDDKAQIEIGPARTDYTLYADKVELCKIGDYQDYIYKSNGTWYLHKEIGKIVDNGASGWGTSGAPTASGVSAYVHTGFNIPDYTPGYANMATLKTKWSDWTSGDGLQSGAAVFNSNNYYLKISTSIASTVAQLQAFLGGSPLITYYPLATAVDTPITGTLLDEFNAFDQATSYKGNTYITVSSVSPDLPATLSVAVEQESALPVATETSVGVVSVGDGLSITEGGVLSVDSSKKEVYSTEETRIGTWIDGKPLYRKVVQFTSPANTYTFTQVATGITNADYAFIENGAIKNTAEGWSIQINSARGTSDNDMMNWAVAAWVRLQPNATNFAVSVAGGLNNQPMWVSVLYTKTTD